MVDSRIVSGRTSIAIFITNAVDIEEERNETKASLWIIRLACYEVMI